MTPAQIKQELEQYHGTEQYWKQSMFAGIVYTDGAKRLFELCNAYWLFTEIALSFTPVEEFQVWILKRLSHSSFPNAVLTMEDGNDNRCFQKDIPFTNFPLDEIKLFLTDGVLMLPSEY